MEILLKGNYSYRLSIDEKLENQDMMKNLFENFNKIAQQREKTEEKRKISSCKREMVMV